MLINEFLHTFNMLYDKLSSHGTTISYDLLRYKLLIAYSLSADHEKLAKATSEFAYTSVKEQLGKIFSDPASTSNVPSSSLCANEINHSEEDIHQTYFSGSSRTRAPQSYLQPPNRKPQSSYSTPPHFSAPLTSKSSQCKVAFAKKCRNPVDFKGNFTRCANCDSTNHWVIECPDNSNATYFLYTCNCSEPPCAE